MLNKLDGIVFWIDSTHDYAIIEYILPHLEAPYRIVARNSKVAALLKARGVDATIWPAFPSLVIMTRHAFHRFPIKAIKKIGMKHGTYHFKKMIHPDKYNAFDLFLFNSEFEAKEAAGMGITCGVAGGYSRLDAFSDPKTIENSHAIKETPGFDNNKKTLLFTATWDGSGMSAIDQWIDHLEGLTSRYNIMLSLHPMMSEGIARKARSIAGIMFAEPELLPAYMLAADVLISDTSSVMAEFCALDKPIITFRVEKAKRLTPEIREMISDISLQISSIDELHQAVAQHEGQPDTKRAQRQRWTQVFYGDIHQGHGKKTAAKINDFVKLHSH